jgi:hypothetical protein
VIAYSGQTHLQTQQDLSWAAVITHDKPVIRAFGFAVSILEHIVASSSASGGEFAILPSESLLVPLQLAARLLSITFGATHRTSSALQDVCLPVWRFVHGCYGLI